MASINQYICDANTDLHQEFNVLQQEMSTRMVCYRRPGSSVQENLIRILRATGTVYIHEGSVVLPRVSRGRIHGEERNYYDAYAGLSKRSREIVESIRAAIGNRQLSIEVSESELKGVRLDFPSTVKKINEIIDEADDSLLGEFKKLLSEMLELKVKLFSPGGSFSRRLYSLIEATGTLYMRNGDYVLIPIENPWRRLHWKFYCVYLRLNPECKEIVETIRKRIGDVQDVIELPPKV